MDKKTLAAMFEGIVAEIASTHDLEEGVARAFVGTALQQSRSAFVAAVAIPKLQIAAPAAA